jgi:hypothetical protein
VSAYVGNARERIVELATANVGAGPTTDTPAITLSPRSSRGLPTTGLAIVLIPLTPNSDDVGQVAQPTAPGFTLTLWRAIPTIGGWSTLQAYPGLNYGDQVVLPDISGGFGLYFQLGNIDTPGRLLLGLAELD